MTEELEAEAMPNPVREFLDDPAAWSYVNGFPLLPKIASITITNEDVNRIREEEGI